MHFVASGMTKRRLTRSFKVRKFMPLAGKVQLRLDRMGKRHALLREWKLEACDFWQQGGLPMVQGPGSR